MATPPRSVLRLIWKAHRAVFRKTGGRIGRRLGGMPCLMLTTTGHRSGESRDIMISYEDHPDGWVVVASNAGADVDPAWWKNLQADPTATVLVDGSVVAVRARELGGEERAGAWSRITAKQDAYVAYADAADRPIPVVLLERVPTP